MKETMDILKITPKGRDIYAGEQFYKYKFNKVLIINEQYINQNNIPFQAASKQK
jgi:hypothetical protein